MIVFFASLCVLYVILRPLPAMLTGWLHNLPPPHFPPSPFYVLEGHGGGGLGGGVDSLFSPSRVISRFVCALRNFFPHIYWAIEDDLLGSKI